MIPFGSLSRNTQCGNDAQALAGHGPPDGEPSAPFRTRLAGAGRHLPDDASDDNELMSTTRHHTHIDLERLTGIHERRVSVGDEDSYSLATSAALDCLARPTHGRVVDVVISCSITKFRGGLTQWLEPTMSGAVAHAIGATNAMTFDVSNACAGMLTGVTVLTTGFGRAPSSAGWWSAASTSRSSARMPPATSAPS